MMGKTQHTVPTSPLRYFVTLFYIGATTMMLFSTMLSVMTAPKINTSATAAAKQEAKPRRLYSCYAGDY